MGLWHTQGACRLESQPPRRWGQTCCDTGCRSNLRKHRCEAVEQKLLGRKCVTWHSGIRPRRMQQQKCAVVIKAFSFTSYLHTSCLHTDLISYISTYVGPFDSKLTNYIILCHQYWLLDYYILQWHYPSTQTVHRDSGQQSAVHYIRVPWARVCVSYINNKFLLALYKEGARCVFLHLADMRHVQQTPCSLDVQIL